MAKAKTNQVQVTLPPPDTSGLDFGSCSPTLQGQKVFQVQKHFPIKIHQYHPYNYNNSTLLFLFLDFLSNKSQNSAPTDTSPTTTPASPSLTTPQHWRTWSLLEEPCLQETRARTQERTWM